MIELGDKVKDKITGFEGIVDATTRFLSGCVRVLVVSPKLKDGSPVDHWFDEDRLELVSKSNLTKKEETTGGERADPPRPANPRT